MKNLNHDYPELKYLLNKKVVAIRVTGWDTSPATLEIDFGTHTLAIVLKTHNSEHCLNLAVITNVSDDWIREDK